MADLSGASVPRLPRGVRLHFDRVRDAHVLLAPERAFTIDSGAVAVLRLVDGIRSVAQIAASLAPAYDADPTVIERDIIAMLTALAAKQVVVAA